jgi:two-component system nitrate/nitrite response regulator NarL
MKQTQETVQTIRLLLADDHPVVREGIRSCLSAHAHLEIVGESSDGPETVRLAGRLQPDLVLLDINMPGMSGLEITEQLKSEQPEIKVLVLTVHNRKEYVLQIVRAGAMGYILKDASPQELVRAIELVHTGETYFSAEVARFVLNEFVARGGKPELEGSSELSAREQEVLIKIAEGCSNKQTADQLGVSVRTVETHRERIMRKLEINSVAGLTKFAISKGLIQLE